MPLSLCSRGSMRSVHPLPGSQVLPSAPSLDLASSLLKDKRRQLLQPFLNSGLLWVSSIHLMGSVSLGYLHKAGANELKETGLISELPPLPLPPSGFLVLLLLECSKLFLILLKHFF